MDLGARSHFFISGHAGGRLADLTSTDVPLGGAIDIED
jgi:hypothetical protein